MIETLNELSKAFPDVKLGLLQDILNYFRQHEADTIGDASAREGEDHIRMAGGSSLVSEVDTTSPTNQTMNDCREAFEAAYNAKFSEIEFSSYVRPHYNHAQVNHDWIAFQKGWNACPSEIAINPIVSALRKRLCSLWPADNAKEDSDVMVCFRNKEDASNFQRALFGEPPITPIREQSETLNNTLHELISEQLEYEQGQNREAMDLLDKAGVASNGEEGIGKRQSLTLPQRIERLLKRELEKHNGLTLKKCLGFFVSVIKSGEPWTQTCQREYDKALNGEEFRKLQHTYEIARQQAYVDNNKPQQFYWEGALRALQDIGNANG